MNTGRTVLAQLFDFISKYEFEKCVNKYHGNYKSQTFSCWDQYVVMSFAQLTYRESLRDIEACLQAVSGKLYHCGIRGNVARSTLAYWNETRDWRIYADFAQVLISEARKLYADDNEFKLDIDGLVYAFDSTTIDLCLTLFPWAKFRKTKAAVKAHTLLDLRGNIPTWIHITDGSVHDVNVLDELILEPGAYYVMDRGYIDYERLFHIHSSSAYFVTRAKDNFSFKRQYSAEVDKSTGVQCDQTVVLLGARVKKDYPEKLRRIKYYDEKLKKTFVFLTNQFALEALLIAKLYKSRWEVELFFKWVKQHLRIKAFYGTTRNAVYTQIWIAVSIYLLVAIMKKKLNLENTLYNILQILSITLFEKMPIQQAFQDIELQNTNRGTPNQLKLF
jgi:transposase